MVFKCSRGEPEKYLLPLLRAMKDTWNPLLGQPTRAEAILRKQIPQAQE